MRAPISPRFDVLRADPNDGIRRFQQSLHRAGMALWLFKSFLGFISNVSNAVFLVVAVLASVGVRIYRTHCSPRGSHACRMVRRRGT